MRAVQVVPLLLLLTSVSCSGVRTPEDPTRPPPPKTTVEVRNQKPIDFNMYVLSETTRIRLGLVPGMSSRTFTIPPHLLPNEQGLLRFQADPIGSNAVSTSDQELMVRAGDELSLTLQ
ncbi:hypothetical protein [Hyalangium gracile]|uniref:hypothetical protein n=1 Tax=Hyalangium gracile TaxID=394092 RepID=UPI001CCE3AE0|nr:hypothetical protein [Hyalangium gracile]